MDTTAFMLFLLWIHASDCWKCETDLHPDPSNGIPTYVLDLDLPPETRWYVMTHDKKAELKQLVSGVESLMKTILGDYLFALVYRNIPMMTSTLPSPYQEELRSIAQTADISITDVTMYNLFYELFVLCTSVVVDDDGEGHILHARNLDNGAFLGWNMKNHTWRVTEQLKQLTVKLEWHKRGELLFESISFVGYVGVLTAVKQNKFSFSLDKRFSLNNGIVGLMEWLVFNDRNQHWVSLLPRAVMENAESFAEAKQQLTETRLIAPVYYIIAGTEPSQGAVITRYRDDAEVMTLSSENWYLVQTNYDRWVQPPFFDDRRTPCKKCLQQFTRHNCTAQNLFNVLSTKPIRNKNTVYTAVMNAQRGSIDAWKSYCPDPCFPWMV